MAARLGRPCVFFPSGRLAMYVALRSSLGPGNRILMSPVTDDVIFFTVLAAGLRPVMAPLSAADGNIEPSLVPEDLWPTLDAVLTTNLYGLPDRVVALRSRCDELGIPLIEDAAHAIQTEVDGRRIGTFGEIAGFSLSKQVGAACGGILAFTDEGDRTELEHMRDVAMVPSEGRERRIRVGAVYAEALVVGLHLVWPVRWLRRKLRLAERRTNRMPLRAQALERAVARGPDLTAFHPWVRVDRHDYRVRPSSILLERAIRRLRDLDGDQVRRAEAVDRLRALPMVAPAARSGDPQPLFRVPLLVDDRPGVVARLERQIRSIGYIYDPPLDDYAGPAFADPSPAPDVARSWASQVVPVDPLDVERVIRALPG